MAQKKFENRATGLSEALQAEIEKYYENVDYPDISGNEIISFLSQEKYDKLLEDVAENIMDDIDFWNIIYSHADSAQRKI